MKAPTGRDDEEVDGHPDIHLQPGTGSWDFGGGLAATHRLIVIHEGRRTHGFGAELVAQLTERHFYDLEAPPLRIASMDLPVPFAPELENAFRPTKEKIIDQIATWMG